LRRYDFYFKLARKTAKYDGLSKKRLTNLQIEYGLWSHAEEEVEDGEVWLESITMLEDLPIGFRLKVCIGLGMLGMDDFAEIRKGCWLLAVGCWLYIFCGIFYLRMNINEFTDLLADGFVEID
jgi:hypothetical protein